jgi:hypothetical protein
VAADPALREALSGLTTTMLIRRCAQLQATTPADVTSTAVYTLRLLARRIQELTAEICDRSTASPSADYAATLAPATTSPAASPKAKPAAKPSAASSDT